MQLLNQVDVLKTKSGLWKVELYIRAEWRSVLIHSGLEFVEMAGMIMMLLWYAINLVMDEMVSDIL